jgi:hypothetical protein
MRKRSDNGYCAYPSLQPDVAASLALDLGETYVQQGKLPKPASWLGDFAKIGTRNKFPALRAILVGSHAGDAPK